MLRNALAFLSLLWALSVVASQARAADESVDQTLMAYLRAHGASDVSLLEHRFMFEGQAHALEVTAATRGCVGFLVVGLGEVRDVDLTVYTVSGLPLDEDVAAAPYAYVRACTDRDEPMIVGMSLYAGRGELSIFRVESAPRELGRLPASIPFAVMAGGTLEPAQAIGESVDEGSISSVLATEESTFSGLGYIALGPPELLDLREGGAGVAPLWMAGHCYRVVVHGPGLRGLSVDVASEIPGRPSTREAGRDTVNVAFCAQRSGPHPLAVRSAIGSGLAVLRVFEHPAAKFDVAPWISLGTAELGEQLQARGFSLHHLGDAWLESRDASHFEASMTQGECYAAAASASTATPVDLRLVDPHGRIVSRTEGRNGVPLVYACASETGAHQIVLTSRGRDQRVSVWLGVSKAKARR